jgi:hypothetical protein
MARKTNVPANRYGQQITVPYAEYIGGGKQWNGAGSAAHGPGMILTHTFSTPWPNRFTYLKDALGWSMRNGARLQRKLPWQVLNACRRHGEDRAASGDHPGDCCRRAQRLSASR